MLYFVNLHFAGAVPQGTATRLTTAAVILVMFTCTGWPKK